LKIDEMDALLPDDATLWEALPEGRVGGEWILSPDMDDDAARALIGHTLGSLVARAARVATQHGAHRLRVEITALREGPV
jgi:hypothetical protein